LQVRADEIFYKNFKVMQPFEKLLDYNLTYSPAEVMPSYSHYLAAQEQITALGYRGFEASMTPNDNKPYKISSRLTLEAISLACAWGLHSGLKSVVLAEMPIAVQYAHFTRHLSLVQMVQLVSLICAKMGQHPDLISRTEPELPMTAASKLYSDVFLGASDSFAAQVIHSLASKGGPIVVLTGTGQHYGLRHFLTSPPQEANLTLNYRHKSIVRTDSTEAVIDKLALLDAIFNGATSIYKVIDSSWNYRAIEVIRQLIDEDEARSKAEWSPELKIRTLDMYHKLYLSMLRKHCTFVERQTKRGRDEMHSEFLKTILDALN
jgi:hypothetical protein